jgi:hypothetical protein
MIIKRFDKEGNKYYLNAFTGKIVKLQYASPLKKNIKVKEDSRNLSIPMTFGDAYEKSMFENNQRSAFMGNYKRLMRMKLEDRNRKEFILACKRVNVNPWPLMNVCAIQNK